MSAVDGFIGVKMNLDNKFYNDKAIKAYTARAKKMMKYVVHTQEALCSHNQE